MPKQRINIKRLPTGYFSTFTGGSYPSNNISFNTSGQISGFPASGNTVAFLLSLVGTNGRTNATTVNGNITVTLETAGVGARTYFKPTSLTVDQWGRVTAISTNTTTTNQLSYGDIILPSSVTINSTGYISSATSALPALTTVTTVTVGVGGMHSMGAIAEPITYLTGATGVVTHNFNLGNFWSHSSPAANFTANFTNIPSTQNIIINLSILVIQGASAYIPNAVQINGAAQTIKWFAASAPVGRPNTHDYFSFTLININGTWTVLGSKSNYL